MGIKVALAGNPNCGKTTLFNALTGANQYVGNWPGVTVEKKEGKIKWDKEITITDLPGIYSLSPYTLEEVVARDYLISDSPDVILNIVDGTNLERNLYLSTQLAELGIPMVMAINMMDIVSSRGDSIDCRALSKKIGIPVMEISAVKGTGVREAIAAVKNQVGHSAPRMQNLFSGNLSAALSSLEEMISSVPAVNGQNRRWYAIKLFERDEKVLAQLQLPDALSKEIEQQIDAVEQAADDDSESIVTSARYDYITSLLQGVYKKKSQGKTTISDKIDRVVTNRFAALPIFVVVMAVVYWVSMGPLGTFLTDWTNDTLFAGWIQGGLGDWLTGMNIADWLVGLLVDGIVGGVGAVLGFVPQMIVLFIFLAILEDIGYMARVAFIMDRIFRHFGLSGKSFIPMLIGSGCGVPGVMASRTIEQDRDRKMTIMTTCFVPCGAKMPIIGLFAGALFGNSGLVAVSAYFIGVAAIIISGIILKKTRAFAGEPAPFVMELPAYHLPRFGNVLRATWERAWSFIKRAGTVILLSSIILWFLQGFGFADGKFGMVPDNNSSLLAAIGSGIDWLFAPLGFGTWQAAVATFTGLIAKENVVSTFAVLYNYVGELSENGEEIWAALAASGDFTQLSAYSFMIFNLLCAPCFAAMGAIRREMNNAKWTAAAIGYMCAFAYISSLIIYQLVGLMIGEVTFGVGTVLALAALVLLVYMLLRRGYQPKNENRLRSVEAAAK